MWQEARRQEKHLKTLMVDYKRRAERRRDYYERIKQDPIKFLRVYGRPSKLHLDSDVVKAAENPNNMMPWIGDQSIMIDRFDVRANLEHYDSRISEDSKPTPVERIESRLCNYERYRCLIHNEFAGVTEAMTLKQIELDEKYGDLDKKRKEEDEANTVKKSQEPKAAIGFKYEDSNVTSETTDSPNLITPLDESDSDGEADSDMDIDVELDVATLSLDARRLLAKSASTFGLHPTDFVRLLDADQQLETELRLAKALEEEKLQLSGRKSRRSRRLLRERRAQEKYPRILTAKVGLLNGQPISRRTVYLSASSSDSGDYLSDVDEEESFNITSSRAQRARAKPVLSNARGPSILIGGMTSISLCRRHHMHSGSLGGGSKFRSNSSQSSSSGHSSIGGANDSRSRHRSSSSSDLSYSTRKSHRGSHHHHTKRSTRVEYITAFGENESEHVKKSNDKLESNTGQNNFEYGLKLLNDKNSKPPGLAASVVAASVVSKLLNNSTAKPSSAFSVKNSDANLLSQTYRSGSDRNDSSVRFSRDQNRRRRLHDSRSRYRSRSRSRSSSGPSCNRRITSSRRSPSKSRRSDSGRGYRSNVHSRRSPGLRSRRRSTSSRRSRTSSSSPSRSPSSDRRISRNRSDAHQPTKHCSRENSRNSNDHEGEQQPPPPIRKRYYRPELESDDEPRFSDDDDDDDGGNNDFKRNQDSSSGANGQQFTRKSDSAIVGNLAGKMISQSSGTSSSILSLNLKISSCSTVGNTTVTNNHNSSSSSTTTTTTSTSTKATSSTRLLPQELLKRRVQSQLAKAFNADKKAELEKQVQLERERQAREEGLRRQARLLRRQEEKRLRAERARAIGHRSDSSSSSSNSSRSSSTRRRITSRRSRHSPRSYGRSPPYGYSSYRRRVSPEYERSRPRQESNRRMSVRSPRALISRLPSPPSSSSYNKSGSSFDAASSSYKNSTQDSTRRSSYDEQNSMGVNSWNANNEQYSNPPASGIAKDKCSGPFDRRNEFTNKLSNYSHGINTIQSLIDNTGNSNIVRK